MLNICPPISRPNTKHSQTPAPGKNHPAVPISQALLGAFSSVSTLQNQSFVLKGLLESGILSLKCYINRRFLPNVKRDKLPGWLTKSFTRRGLPEFLL